MAPRRLGVFGGTFDPPHVGHLALAEWARERLDLERVLFVPAGQPPHKRRGPISSPRARLTMTRLAVRGQPAFEVCTLELEAPGPSYTVETLRALHQLHPRRRFYLLIGADSLEELSTWREPEVILELATLAVARRPGTGSVGSTFAPSRWVVDLANPVFDVSSTMLRERLRAGRSVRYLVPDAVARYATRHRLYRRRAR